MTQDSKLRTNMLSSWSRDQLIFKPKKIRIHAFPFLSRWDNTQTLTSNGILINQNSCVSLTLSRHIRRGHDECRRHESRPPGGNVHRLQSSISLCARMSHFPKKSNKKRTLILQFAKPPPQVLAGPQCASVPFILQSLCARKSRRCGSSKASSNAPSLTAHYDMTPATSRFSSDLSFIYIFRFCFKFVICNFRFICCWISKSRFNFVIWNLFVVEMFSFGTYLLLKIEIMIVYMCCDLGIMSGSDDKLNNVWCAWLRLWFRNHYFEWCMMCLIIILWSPLQLTCLISFKLGFLMGIIPPLSDPPKTVPHFINLVIIPPLGCVSSKWTLTCW